MEMNTKHLPGGLEAALAGAALAQALLLISAKPVYVLEAFHVSVRYCNCACVFAGEDQGLAAPNIIIPVHVSSKPTFKRLFLFLDA